MLKPLDPLLHSQVRLSIVSLLLGLEEATFVYLKEKTNTTAGNLSIQLEKLREAGYSDKKRFKGKYPATICKITTKGIREIHF